MKRIATMAAALALTLSLAGCWGGDEPASSMKPTPTPSPAASSSASAGTDESLSGSMDGGMSGSTDGSASGSMPGSGSLAASEGMGNSAVTSGSAG